MSCCTGSLPEDKKVTGTSILANLPTAMVAISDPTKPLASSLKNALPREGGTVYGRPKVHDDGSLEFEPVLDASPPAPLEGYTPDTHNPWLFRPLWEPCLKRLAGFRKATDGTLTLKMACQNPAVTEHYMRFVGYSVCSACPLRVNEKPRQT